MLKNWFNKDKDLKYDFLPSDLEIIEKPASPLGKAIIYIIAIFILSMIVMASIAKIDKIVVSTGSVNPIDGIKLVDSNLNGKIVNINKNEGDKVQEGEEILQIENFDSAKKEEELKKSLEEYKLQLELISFKINGNYDESVFSKYNIGEDKLQAIKLEYNVDEESVSNDEQEYESKLSKLDESISKIEEEKKELNDKYNKLKDEEKSTLGESILKEIKSKDEEVKNIESQKEKNIRDKESKDNKKKLDNVEKKNNISKKIADVERSLESIDNNNSNYTIKSPINGTIFNMNYNTVNSYVNQNKPIAEVVPDDAEYEVEAFVKNADIARIEMDQEVTIKLDSYDYQKYGTITGSVSYISPNSFNNESLGLVYKIKVKFDKNENENIKVLPGMGATIEIKSEKIRLIEYFLEPFKKNLDNALKG